MAKYFKLSEMCVSASHPELVEVPKAGTQVYRNITSFIDNCLDKVRERLGKPIVITSGYRNERLNRATGGSSTSQHRYGTAADVHTGNNGSDNIKIAVALLESGVSFDQCIFEYPTFSNGKIVSVRWIHIGCNPSGSNMRQVIYTTDGKTYPKLNVSKSFNYSFGK